MIEQIMKTHGIPDWGICRFSDVQPLLDCRAKSRLPENAQSVIVCLLPYFVGDYPQRNISRYAMVDDYHTVGQALLKKVSASLSEQYPDYRFPYFIDSSPIPEVRAAYHAGLGVIGKHGLLIHAAYGSYCFIAELVTDMPLPPAQVFNKLCANCGKCVAHCPTGALQKDGFDQTICRSHITQKKGELTDWETRQILDGGRVWGCDLCQEVCPMNNNCAQTEITMFYENITPVISEENLSETHLRKAFSYRSKTVMHRNLAILSKPLSGDNQK